MVYANDVVLVNRSKEESDAMAKKLNETAEMMGLQIKISERKLRRKEEITYNESTYNQWRNTGNWKSGKPQYFEILIDGGCNKEVEINLGIAKATFS